MEQAGCIIHRGHGGGGGGGDSTPYSLDETAKGDSMHSIRFRWTCKELIEGFEPRLLAYCFFLFRNS